MEPVPSINANKAFSIKFTVQRIPNGSETGMGPDSDTANRPHSFVKCILHINRETTEGLVSFEEDPGTGDKLGSSALFPNTVLFR